MKYPNLWWSAELANEAAGEPLDGLIEGNTYGLFCFQLREWARLASLPADAVRLVPDSPDGVLDRFRELGGALTGFLITLEQEGVQLPSRAERGRAVVSDLLANAWDGPA